MPVSPIVELRRYTLKPGQRDVLIELFDREFVETQEACGMSVIGQFRDLDRPDHFVWLRGFADMEARRKGLETFYGGPVWAAQKEAANGTMIDSDDVYLLRAVKGFQLQGLSRTGGPAGLLVAALFPQDAVLPDFGDALLASFVTEESPNTFPRLPVWEDRKVQAVFLTFANEAAFEAYPVSLAGADVARLQPTDRSLLRAAPGAERDQGGGPNDQR
ncbi:NIPSNAP family protein [Lacibacterium aquatile]|uniref:NIPSNAP family protein n=1 Tax=Lacibacterium aquatile TaxID=1168082 RepID=A0ABW5DLU5_9PROT